MTPENMNEIARIFEVEDDGLERLEEALTHGIPHNILNAKYHEKEAIIIAEAGRKARVPMIGCRKALDALAELEALLAATTK